jgi:hypothetical protein
VKIAVLALVIQSLLDRAQGGIHHSFKSKKNLSKLSRGSPVLHQIFWQPVLKVIHLIEMAYIFDYSFE